MAINVYLTFKCSEIPHLCFSDFNKQDSHAQGHEKRMNVGFIGKYTFNDKTVFRY